MNVSSEDLKRIEAYGLRTHLAIVDGYIFSGHSVDDLTIKHFVIQPDVAMILHAYGYLVGQAYENVTDSKGKYKGLPFDFVEEYVTHFFPGLERPNSDITMESYLEENHPGWRNADGKPKKVGIFSLRLSKEEEDIINGRIKK